MEMKNAPEDGGANNEHAKATNGEKYLTKPQPDRAKATTGQKKMKLCTYWLKGWCDRELYCGFAHGEEELYTARADAEEQVPVCKKILTTKSCWRDDCKYKHVVSRSRSPRRARESKAVSESEFNKGSGRSSAWYYDADPRHRRDADRHVGRFSSKNKILADARDDGGEYAHLGQLVSELTVEVGLKTDKVNDLVEAVNRRDAKLEKLYRELGVRRSQDLALGGEELEALKRKLIEETSEKNKMKVALENEWRKRRADDRLRQDLERQLEDLQDQVAEQKSEIAEEAKAKRKLIDEYEEKAKAMRVVNSEMEWKSS